MRIEIEKTSSKVATIYVNKELYDILGYEIDVQSFYCNSIVHVFTRDNFYEMEEIKEKVLDSEFTKNDYTQEIKDSISIIYDKVTNLVFKEKVNKVFFEIEEK